MKKVVIIGGGISGLAAAFLLRQKADEKGEDLSITVLEKEDVTGGKIRSIKSEGFLCEWGPNGFLDSKPQTLELCRTLGVSDRLLRSNDNARKRFIYSEGMLHRLPENALSFFSSRLISWPGKVRLSLEPFAPGPPPGIDETLAAFGRRRLGKEALRKLIAPMVSGIFAGDPETMSLKSCFPRMVELERDYGGLIMAMLRLARKKRKERAQGKAVSGPSGPGGILTSFNNGIQELTDSLAVTLRDETISTGQGVAGIVKGKSLPYRVITGSGDQEADLVIAAAPACETAGMMRQLDRGIAEILHEIKYASMTVVCFGYEKDKIARDLDGFGYLIPKEEGMNTLGTLWDSSIFTNRAPEGYVLLRSMLGGACFPEYLELPDEEVVRRVRSDLSETMGIKDPPVFVRIFRHEKAIPQYTVGHGDRLRALEERLEKHPGLLLTGNSYRGVGLNDCVAAAARTAEEGMRYLQKR